jgi:hypothetical protein
MPQYAYIPIARTGNLPYPQNYAVRLAVYVPGYAPDVVDSNGNGIPNILELDAPAFTDTQKADILALEGQWFEDAAAYLAWKESLVTP